MPLTRIDEYDVLYSANAFAPEIWLKRDGRFIGKLIFRPNGSALPPDRTVGDQVFLFYHREDFGNAIDLLRNENPMFLVFNGSGEGFHNGIKTTAEAAGEGEAADRR
jgi:hypothetical protein